LEQKDPLDKYSKGVTIDIHDAHPSSVYTRIKQEVLDEWSTMEGKTLLAIPFGNNAESQAKSQRQTLRSSPMLGLDLLEELEPGGTMTACFQGPPLQSTPPQTKAGCLCSIGLGPLPPPHLQMDP